MSFCCTIIIKATTCHRKRAKYLGVNILTSSVYGHGDVYHVEGSIASSCDSNFIQMLIRFIWVKLDIVTHTRACLYYFLCCPEPLKYGMIGAFLVKLYGIISQGFTVLAESLGTLKFTLFFSGGQCHNSFLYSVIITLMVICQLTSRG